MIRGVTSYDQARDLARMVLAQQAHGFDQIKLPFALANCSRQQDHHLSRRDPQPSARAISRPAAQSCFKSLSIQTVVNNHIVVPGIKRAPHVERRTGHEHDPVWIAKAFEHPASDLSRQKIKIGLPRLALSRIPHGRQI